jgi:hypothetical protein
VVSDQEFQIPHVPFNGSAIKVLIYPPSGSEVIDHVRIDSSERIGKPVFGELPEPGGLVHEVQFVLESRDLTFPEFSVKERQALEVGPVRHLAEQIGSGKSLSKQLVFFIFKNNLVNLSIEPRTSQTIPGCLEIHTGNSVHVSIKFQKRNTTVDMRKSKLTARSRQFVIFLNVTRIVQNSGNQPHHQVVRTNDFSVQRSAVKESGHRKEAVGRVFQVMVVDVTLAVTGELTVEKAEGLLKSSLERIEIRMWLDERDNPADLGENGSWIIHIYEIFQFQRPTDLGSDPDFVRPEMG